MAKKKGFDFSMLGDKNDGMTKDGHQEGKAEKHHGKAKKHHMRGKKKG